MNLDSRSRQRIRDITWRTLQQQEIIEGGDKDLSGRDSGAIC